jgi:hypothetical protein
MKTKKSPSDRLREKLVPWKIVEDLQQDQKPFNQHEFERLAKAARATFTDEDLQRIKSC